MVGTPKEEYAPLMRGITGAQIAAWWDRAVDVIPAAAGKGVGVQAVLDHYGFTADQAIAFGDGNNDLEMLQVVGTGVAMGNASQESESRRDLRLPQLRPGRDLLVLQGAGADLKENLWGRMQMRTIQ